MAALADEFPVGPAPHEPPERRGIPLVWGDQVQPRALRWLWSGRVASGKVTIFEGDPSEGKSTVSTDIAARFTRGTRLPDGAEPGTPQRVLIASAEDTIDDVIVPRLLAAGADLRLVAFHRLGRDPETGQVVPLVIPKDLDRLAETVVAHEIPLVFLDPLVAFLGEEIRSHVDASVRQAMGPLSIMAEETGTAVVGLRHLNKSGDDNPMYRGGGSIAFGAAARSVLLFARHREDPALHVIAQVKTNLSAAGEASSLGYRIEAADGPYGPQPIIAWLAEPLGITAAELLRRGGGRDDAPKRSDAQEFLLDVLADGPAEVERLKGLAKAAGFAWRTVERAKEQSEQIASQRVRDDTGKTVGWCWALVPEVDDGAF